MLSGNTFIAQARTWIGTPFHHQGRLKGVGCDCLGLIVGVAEDSSRIFLAYPYRCMMKSPTPKNLMEPI
jgi:hypothetical protein